MTNNTPTPDAGETPDWLSGVDDVQTKALLTEMRRANTAEDKLRETRQLIQALMTFLYHKDTDAVESAIYRAAVAWLEENPQ